jgi:hypothetical protein
MFYCRSGGLTVTGVQSATRASFLNVVMFLNPSLHNMQEVPANVDSLNFTFCMLSFATTSEVVQISSQFTPSRACMFQILLVKFLF